MASLRLKPSQAPSRDAQGMPIPGGTCVGEEDFQPAAAWGLRPGGPTHLVVVHHCDVRGRLLDLAEVDDGVLLGAWYAAGGQDLIVLVHAQRLPAQVLHWQGLTVGQGDNEGLLGKYEGRREEGAAGYGWGLGRLSQVLYQQCFPTSP